MKKILLSLATIAIVGIAATGLTVSFYGDTETSTGNTFTAGSVELKVDSTSHYNYMVCTGDGTACDGSWQQKDLENGVDKFFNFTDIKPGDHGEDTISLHVIDNDAWGRFLLDNVLDQDNTCTVPEQVAENDQCVEPDGDGEVDENLNWHIWLDQGSEPGFQCGNPELQTECSDTEEGNNIQDADEPTIYDGTIGGFGPFDLKDILIAAYDASCTEGPSADGHDDYGLCHGLASDGRMVGSTTYYFGLAWELPIETGNEVQSDSFTADMIFQVEQFRNNPNPFD